MGFSLLAMADGEKLQASCTNADNAASWLHGFWLGRDGIICNKGVSCNDVMLHRVLFGENVHCPQSCLIFDGLILHHRACQAGLH